MGPAVDVVDRGREEEARHGYRSIQAFSASAWTSLIGSLCSCRGPYAILELGGRVQHLAVAPRDFEADLADRRLDGLPLAIEAFTQHLAMAHADRRRFREQHAGNFVPALRPGDDRDQRPRTILLHLDGRVEHVERSGGVETVHQRTEQLRVHVVDLALQRHDRLHRRPDFGVADEHAKHVGMTAEVLVTGAIADPLHAHREEVDQNSSRKR